MAGLIGNLWRGQQTPRLPSFLAKLLSATMVVAITGASLPGKMRVLAAESALQLGMAYVPPDARVAITVWTCLSGCWVDNGSQASTMDFAIKIQLLWQYTCISYGLLEITLGFLLCPPSCQSGRMTQVRFGMLGLSKPKEPVISPMLASLGWMQSDC